MPQTLPQPSPSDIIPDSQTTPDQPRSGSFPEDVRHKQIRVRQKQVAGEAERGAQTKRPVSPPPIMGQVIDAARRFRKELDPGQRPPRPSRPNGNRPVGFPLARQHMKLIQDGDSLFSKITTLQCFWQECALNFLPNMAEFTTTRYLGQEYTDHLTTSYPIIARRQLGDAIGAMLRPMTLDNASPGVWFSITTEDQKVAEDQTARRWMEWASGVMRRAMYDRTSGFVRATKQTDHAFVTFGQSPLFIGTSPNRDRLVFQSVHLKDTAFTEDEWGCINNIHIKFKMTPDQVLGRFGANASPKVSLQAQVLLPGGQTSATSQHTGTLDIRHIVMRSDD